MELKELKANFPLPEGWSELEVYQETLRIGETTLFLIGLAATSPNGQQVTGSAAEPVTFPVARAYFELLERISVINATESAEQNIILLGEEENEVGTLLVSEIFLKSPKPELWNYSRSNGVALFSDWKEAAQRAKWELMERDRILRSWYGQIMPVKITTYRTPSFFPRCLEEHYHFEYYSFINPNKKEGTEVAAVFGFPKSKGVPRVYGAAARNSLSQAIEAAVNECYQGIGFLWGEKLPDSTPGFSPTVDYHQELFLHESGIEKIRHWLSGGHLQYGKESFLTTGNFSFVDLTPPFLKGKLRVAKAMHSGLIPLSFGKSPHGVPPEFPKELLIHPLS